MGDDKGKLLAVAQAQQSQLVEDALVQSPVLYAIKRYHYNAFAEESQVLEYATPLSITLTATTSLESLDQQCQPNELDRLTTKSYHSEGWLLQKQQLNIQRQQVVIGQDGTPSQRPRLETTLTENYSYTATGKTASYTNANGDTAYFYYDERNNQIAYAGVLRNSQLVENVSQTWIPLTQYLINAHQQKVSTVRYYNGTAKASLTTLPTPLEKSDDDQYEYTLHDTRGLIQYQQDANGQLTASTYTASKKIARKIWQLTNWEKDDNNALIEVVHLEEKRWLYDDCDRIQCQGYFRDQQVVQETGQQHNLFNELIAEGPGSDSFPKYRQFDTSGRLWNDNSKDGSAKITLYDLQQNATAELQSASLNLSTIGLDGLKSLLEQDFFTVERRQLWVDPQGRLLCEVLPTNIGKDETSYRTLAYACRVVASIPS